MKNAMESKEAIALTAEELGECVLHRRFKILHIDFAYLPLFLQRRAMFPSDLFPGNAHVHRIYVDNAYPMLCIVLTHPDFEEVPVNVIPQHIQTYRLWHLTSDITNAMKALVDGDIAGYFDALQPQEKDAIVDHVKREC